MILPVRGWYLLIDHFRELFSLALGFVGDISCIRGLINDLRVYLFCPRDYFLPHTRIWLLLFKGLKILFHVTNLDPILFLKIALGFLWGWSKLLVAEILLNELLTEHLWFFRSSN